MLTPVAALRRIEADQPIQMPLIAHRVAVDGKDRYRRARGRPDVRDTDEDRRRSSLEEQ